MSGKFGYMGGSNLWGDIDQMWLVGRYGGRNHVCNISWLSVKGCECGERGKFAFSHRLDGSPLQHWSHYRVTVWWADLCIGDVIMTWVFLQIYCWVQQWKDFLNWPTFLKVVNKYRVSRFYGQRCITPPPSVREKRLWIFSRCFFFYKVPLRNGWCRYRFC